MPIKAETLTIILFFYRFPLVHENGMAQNEKAQDEEQYVQYIYLFFTFKPLRCEGCLLT